MGTSPRPRGSLLIASCWLAVILVAAKAACGEIPWLPHLPARLLTLIASSFSDVLFALALGVIAQVSLLLVRRWRRVAAVVRAGFLAFFAACAAYAVAAVGLFHYFRRPLTAALLGMIGNAATVRSSIVERITLPIAIGLLLAPAMLLLLSTGFRPSRRTAAVAMTLAMMWITAGSLLHANGWEAQKLEFLWLSPHAELLRTAAVRITRSRPVLPQDFPPEYVEEFRTFRARGVPAAQTFTPPAGVPRPRNAIVIVLESIGTKYLHLYGHPEEFTPTLTRESRHALVFDNIYAHASFTYASFRPLNFSVYPGLPWHYSLLEDGRPLPGTLAATMKSRGARTAYFTSGDLDWGDQRWLLDRGRSFDQLRGSSQLGCGVLSSWGAEDRCLVDRLIEWIAEKPGEPFFAVCWTDQTHDPFLLSPGATAVDVFAGKPRPPFADDLSRYLNILRDTDAHLARLFVALRERGLADETVVLITGDHGEAFADPHQQRGHAWSVFDEEIHVPFMIWNPRLFPETQRSQQIGGHVDLNPTLADLLGLEPQPEWQGHSLFAPERPNRAYFMAIAGGDVFGVREGDWKYIYDVTSGRESLFHLARDPQEQHDVAAAEPEISLRLRQRVAAWVSFEDAFLWGREN